ncbi:hypothetical protein BX666DRAFT_178427 [Dichotomocladium elegans]|nr:hypothetical protein BX666DRAFT_178427 [Dichotomocladium elegans]
MKFWFALALGVPAGVLFNSYFMSLSWANTLLHMCPDYKDSRITGSEGMDTALCFVGNVFTHAIHDPLGYDLAWILLGLFGAALALFSVEGSRTKANRVLGATALWGLAYNARGLAVIQPMLWLPAFYYCYGDRRDNPKSYYIEPARVNAILFVTVAVYLVPTLVMLYGVEQGSKLEFIVIAAWQFVPIPMQFLLRPLASALRHLDEPFNTRLTEETQDKLRTADSKNAVERLYMFLGIVNVLIYYGVYVHLQFQGMFSWETLVDFFTIHSGKLTALSIEQLGHMTATHLFAIEIAACFGTFLLWALMENGLKGLAIMLVSSIVLGPGGAICLFAVYRENTIQDTGMLVKKSQ